MITRTFITTNVKAMAVDMTAVEVKDIDITLPVQVEKHDIEKYLAKNPALVPENYKVVAIKETTYNETLYGMDESVFLANAVILPPRGTKKTEAAE